MAKNEDTRESSVTTKQAEEIVDRFMKQASVFVTRAAHQLAKAGARMREEAEDILAEAQELADREERAAK